VSRGVSPLGSENRNVTPVKNVSDAGAIRVAPSVFSLPQKLDLVALIVRPPKLNNNVSSDTTTFLPFITSLPNVFFNYYH